MKKHLFWLLLCLVLSSCKKQDFHSVQTRAQGGDAEAQFQLGMFYVKGQSVAQDFHKAASWWQKAALQNYPPAEDNLAEMYVWGKGVPRNPEKAMELWQRAAQQEYAHAQFMLANSYLEKEQYVEARHWYKKAIKNGYTRAYGPLGILYGLGKGGPKDTEKMREMVQKSLENKDKSQEEKTMDEAVQKYFKADLN